MATADLDQFKNWRGISSAIRRASNMLRPPPDLKPSDWAEANIRIPVGNAVPGLIRFDNAPYQREPLDMTVNPDCHRITLMWGAQTGKTQVLLCSKAYNIAHNPSSQIMMQPSQNDLQTWLETKFTPMVDTNPVLAELIAKPRGREGVNNQRMKSYPGGFLMFSWSGSPKTMRGRSAPKIFCDEVDGYEVTAEGHPVGLLWQRAATFGDAALLMDTSTPTVKGASAIETGFEEGDRRRYYVSCPHCRELQTLKWANVQWTKDAEGNHLPETAGYACESCGVLWNDGERIAAVRQAERQGGGWKAEKPFRGHASYHLNELYSTFRKLRQIVQSFLDKKAQGDLQTFVNVSLAETWEEEAEKVSADSIMARAEKFRAQVPAGGVYLSAGVDMQIDRLEVEVVAWGAGEESWTVDVQVLWGDPTQPDVWDDLDDYLARTFQHESGAQLTVSATGIDTGGTGGMTQAAYDYCKGKQGRRIFALKGVGGWGRPIVTSPSRKRTGKRQRPVDLFTVGVDESKLIMMRRLRVSEPGPGYCHFPDTLDAEYFAQLTGEKLVTRYVKGFPVREWHKTRDRNEAIDRRNYAYAALKIMNPNLHKLAERLNGKDDDDHPAASELAARAEKGRRRPARPARQPANDKQQDNPPEDDRDDEMQTGTIRRSSRLKQRTGRRRRSGGGWVNNW